jgi:hypothetical protein
VLALRLDQGTYQVFERPQEATDRVPSRALRQPINVSLRELSAAKLLWFVNVLSLSFSVQGTAVIR